MGKGHGSLYNAPRKEERRRRKTKRREKSDHILILDLKTASYRIHESKKKERCSIYCMLLGYMMICGIEFVDLVVKVGKGVNELSFWCSFHLRYFSSFVIVDRKVQELSRITGKHIC